MDLSSVKSIAIPEGIVTKITNGDSVLWEQVTFPSEYQKVEYIATDGYQWVDTGVRAWDYQSGIYCDMDFMITKQNGFGDVYMYFYGMGCSGYHSAGSFGFSNYAGNCKYYCGQGMNALYIWNSSLLNKRTAIKMLCNSNDPTASRESLQVYDRNNPETTIRFHAQYNSQPCPMPDKNIYMLNCNGNEANIGPFGRLYAFTMADANGNLIRDFIPCYRKTDGVIGAFDMVTKQFFTNSGTGDFTKGADV